MHLNLRQKQILLAFFSFTFIFICYKIFSKEAIDIPQEIKVVEVEKISLSDITQTANLIGTIQAKYSTILTAQEDGIFQKVSPAGSEVLKGQMIAKIINTEIEMNLELYKEAEKIAFDQYERAQNLLKTGTYSKSEVEELKNKWINSQKNLADAKNIANKLVFYAPFDGILGSYKVKEGQQLTVGDQIASFVDPLHLTVDFDIPVSILPHIKNGQKLVIHNKTYTIPYIQRMLDEAKHMSPTSVNINCEDCIIGSNVDIEISVIDKKQVIVIPFDAVFLKNGKTSVYIVKNNRTVLVPVELGIREKNLIEIASGLEVGDEVIIKGTSRLWPDLEVKIHKENETN